MIKELKDITDLESVTGGMVVIRSGGTRSGNSSTGAPSGSASRFGSALDRFFARREEARARNAQREEDQAERETSGSTRRGFPASAALGNP